ncbi:MAG: UDP-glucose/GDP-mannose dehydrogenase family protein [bacterium]
MMPKSLAVMGTGYVGLVASACLSDLGHDVTAVDIDEERIRTLNSGTVPIYEPGLEELIETNRSEDRLQFTSDWEANLPGKDLIMIAVGTPKREDGSCDLTYVLSAAEMIGQTIEDDTVVVTKSTVPVGTGELIRSRIEEELNKRFEDQPPLVTVGSNPEFLREGSAVQDFRNPDRIVVGSKDLETREILASLYDDLEAPVVTTGLRTAEMIKYASNAMLATKISFINEIANVCEEVGADVLDVAEGMGLDSRINRDFLGAGIGYGGSCFPKDTEALVQIAGQGGYDSQILSAVMAVNRQQRLRFARKIIRKLSDPTGKTVGILGLSFKPNTDDMREAPSIDIIQELQSAGIDVIAYDPVAMEEARERLSGVDYAEDPYEVAKGAEAVALLTEWDEFLDLDYERLVESMETCRIFDGRNVLPMDKLTELGCEYFGVGQGVDRLDDVISQKELLEHSADQSG